MQQYTHENTAVQVQQLTAIKNSSHRQELPRQRAHGKSNYKSIPKEIVAHPSGCSRVKVQL